MSQVKRKREDGSPEATTAVAKDPSATRHAGSAGAKVYHCDYCNRDITNQVRIRCAECQEFDLCLDCFSVGAEIQSHKRSHSYRVMEKLDFPVLSNDWTAHEELMLLQALDLYGLGNWVEVAMHVGTQSKTKCEEHYYQYYIDFPGTGPYPDVSRCTERNTLAPLSASMLADMQQTAQARHMTPQHQPAKKKDYYADCPPGSEIVGYMPRRGDFDVEYDNDAEAVLADLAIDSKDSEWESKLKTTLLEAYNWRLEERRKRKEFVLKRDLLDLKKQQISDRRRTPEDKELHQQLRVFSRVMAPDKYDELLMGLVQEQRIRKRIKELQEFRSMGCFTFDDIERKKSEMPEFSSSSVSGGHHVHKHKHWKSEAAEKKRKLAEQARKLLHLLCLLIAAVTSLQAAKLARQPGGEFLSDKETSLCELLSISPMQVAHPIFFPMLSLLGIAYT
jgi:transcriptional adapter 2-alpha